MKTVRLFLFALLAAGFADAASASWYWPFGTNSVSEADEPRLSELMEPASLAIDEATDFVNDGKTDKAVEKYREALRLLEKLEVENPERAATPEFQSVRNKRAYVDAQLNAILLDEARQNAKAVAVTDTSVLEEKLRKKRAREAGAKRTDGRKPGEAKPSRPNLLDQLGDYMKDARAHAEKLSRAAASAKFERESEERIRELLKDDPESRKARLMRAGLELHRRNYGTARKDIDALLKKNPADVSALNLKAAVDAATGDYAAAEEALSTAIRANRKDYHAYYNLARMLRERGDAKRAARFYRRGHAVGGPADPSFEDDGDGDGGDDE